MTKAGKAITVLMELYDRANPDATLEARLEYRDWAYAIVVDLEKADLL